MEGEMVMEEAALEDQVSPKGEHLVDQDAAEPQSEAAQEEVVITEAEIDVPPEEVEETLQVEGFETIKDDVLEEIPKEKVEDEEKPAEVEETEGGKTAEVEETEGGKTAEVEETEGGTTAEVEESKSWKTAEVEETEGGTTAEVEETEGGTTAEVEETEGGTTAEVEETEGEKTAEVEETEGEKTAEVEETGLNTEVDEKMKVIEQEEVRDDVIATELANVTPEESALTSEDKLLRLDSSKSRKESSLWREISFVKSTTVRHEFQSQSQDISKGALGTLRGSLKSGTEIPVSFSDRLGESVHVGTSDAVQGTEGGVEFAAGADKVSPSNREKIIFEYQAAVSRSEALRVANLAIQNKLAMFFKKKKLAESKDTVKNIVEEKYKKLMDEYIHLKSCYMEEVNNYETRILAAKTKCQEKTDNVEAERNQLMSLKRKVTQKALFCQTRKPIPKEEVEKYLTAGLNKELEISSLRLQNIKIQQRMQKKENMLRSKETLEGGLRMQDFEQFRIENQTFNEKIEERNEELLRLKRKITSTVVILSHLKEKTQFFQVFNKSKYNDLKEVEASLATSRDILTRTKRARDALREDNNKLRHDCGLLGNSALIIDYNKLKDDWHGLQAKLSEIKTRHAALIHRTGELKGLITDASNTLGPKKWAF